MTATPQPLWNEHDAAARTLIPVATLRQWRYLGRGPKFLKLGGHHVRYRPEDVEAWISSCEVKTDA